MAILKTRQGEVEVRIRRHPDNTYYDEYIKVQRKEIDSDDSRERYIISEPGTTYYVEVTLKEDFNFDEYDVVQANLYFRGLEESVSMTSFGKSSISATVRKDRSQSIQYADVEVDGQKMLGARFAFKNIEVDESLSNETDIMDVHPDNLLTFSIKLDFYKRETVRLSDDKYNKALSKWEESCSKARSRSRSLPKPKLNLRSEATTEQPSARYLWDAKKVDQDSYEKRGINTAIGFVGGTKQPPAPKASIPIILPEKPNRTTTTWSRAHFSYKFEFHCRTAEFLEQTGIIKYPPPLYCYSWNILSKNERRTAFQELQDLSKTQWHKDQEEATGLPVPKVGRVEVEENPWEWRQWSRMYVDERRKAFQSLQAKKKARERGKIQSQYENMIGDIVTLGDGDDGDKPRRKSQDTVKKDAKSEKDGVRIKREDVLRNMAKSPDTRTTTSSTAINDESTDLDDDDDCVIIVSATDNPILSAAPKEDDEDPRLRDEELLEKEAALEKLKEDIAQEERVLKMKRERDALAAEIDAAKLRKRIKTE
ncbi:hypothetical protein DSL72_008910 [Monilinia vaccinii-corymbosi]|uniref:DUF7918 domain-containing protein n=1 Tax=Monilinia vaccinii-corymbosi TaxID=61207 RepID=A0A8A3PRM5_9HELO|nr:hypothetical protein DSL72_008910 [Monilinia vaccinii-corymbosi]